MSAKRIQRRQFDAIHRDLHHLPPVLQRVLAARGVDDAKQLQYTLERLCRAELKGIDRAVALLCEALSQQQRVMIVGDFDADGATSTALTMRCLKDLGFQQLRFLVPNRFEFGYGLTPEIVEVAAAERPDLIITVDNGIASVEGVARAQQLGIKVLITDHHLPGATLPDADALINPNQPGCGFLSKNAAGVGVAFYLMLALRAKLKADGHFAEGAVPNLAVYLDLVALGTVADVVPLDYNNRILVAQGLRRIQAGQTCPGIAALMKVAARAPESVTAMDLGFMVGPRLNAAGRLDDMSLGIRCLLTDDPGEALALAQELDGLNRERRAIEASMQKEADDLLQQMLDKLQGALPMALCLYEPSWHQGVIGILASRVKERFHRPTIVFAEDGNGLLKGSGRSVAGVHLRDVLDRVATQNPGLLEKFGGHAMAAGLCLALDKLEAFQAAFEAAVIETLDDGGLEAVIETDGALEAEDFSVELALGIANSGPWGQAFPEPVFDGVFRVVSQKLVGQKHLKMLLTPEKGQAGELIDAIAFNIDTNLWPAPECQSVRAVYKLAVNDFRGRRSCQLMIDYLEVLPR